MAVINSPWVGDARGKLGSGVYFRAKGQTNARSYNPSPLNRRTVSQQVQRSTFSAAVKFYTRGVQNLFDFAFEAKETKESDYNAYMRYNAKLGMYFGPDQNNSEAWPSLAPWVMTRGSLRGKEVVFNTLPHISFDDIQVTPVRTVAWLSQVLLDRDPDYEVGDILTFVNVDAGISAGSPAYPYAHVPEEIPEWYIYQIVIDPSDTTPLPQDEWLLALDAAGNLQVWPHQSDVPSAFCGGCCYVHSRVRNGQVLVSDSQLCLNAQARQAYVYGRSDTWRDVVMAAWQTEEQSILQGSVAARNRVSPGELILSFDLPISTGDLTTDDTITVTGSWTVATLAAVLDVADADGSILDVDADGQVITIGIGDSVSRWTAIVYSDRIVLNYLSSTNPLVLQSMSIRN